MIFNDRELGEWARTGGLTPFNLECVNPASVDLRLSDEFIDLGEGGVFTASALNLHPGQAILASTLEIVRMPVDCAGTVYLKSSLAREGLDHALAGFVDPGFHGTLTLELHAHRAIRLTAGQRVIQLVLHRLTERPQRPYNGRYQGQRGPTLAR